jgi:hypothetical protein
MHNKFFTIGTVIIISTMSFGQVDSLTLFSDDFESFTSGQQLVCQDSINWDTWSSLPCDPTEDPYVSNNTAFSGTNSVWIQQNNDLVKPISEFDSGYYSISFYLYIPTDYTASWGQLASFENPAEWGFYARFNPFGNGTINAGGWDAAQFSFSYDTWMHNELTIDLNNDSAEYYFEGNLVHGWQWTLGSDGDTISRQLSITDIWGGIYPNTGPAQYYIDDFVLERLDTVVNVKDFSLPTEFILSQNYPNPFNATTSIKYQIPELSFVTLKVYDILGNEIATLINEEKPIGSYDIKFNERALTSGIYFYQLHAGSFVKTKKMVLLK